MKTFLFLQEGESKKLLAAVHLEVVPRGLYVVDGIPYQYTGQPIFIIGLHQGEHVLMRTEITVQKVE